MNEPISNITRRGSAGGCLTSCDMSDRYIRSFRVSSPSLFVWSIDSDGWCLWERAAVEIKAGIEKSGSVDEGLKAGSGSSGCQMTVSNGSMVKFSPVFSQRPGRRSSLAAEHIIPNDTAPWSGSFKSIVTSSPGFFFSTSNPGTRVLLCYKRGVTRTTASVW